MHGKEFASCWLKLSRARQHLDCVQSKIREWTNSDPYTHFAKRNSDGNRHSVWVRFNRTPPFDEFALIAGDCVHNLRSVLDHWMYASAIAKTGLKVPPEHRLIQFPICSSPEAFDKQRYRLVNISAKAAAFVERVQPYNRPHQELPPLLSVLNEFDNSDKHRNLNIALAHLMDGKINFSEPIFAKVDAYWLKSPVSLDGESEIMFFNVSPAQPDLRFNYDLALYVTISHIPGRSGKHVSILEDVFVALVKEVERILNEAATL